MMHGVGALSVWQNQVVIGERDIIFTKTWMIATVTIDHLMTLFESLEYSSASCQHMRSSRLSVCRLFHNESLCHQLLISLWSRNKEWRT